MRLPIKCSSCGKERYHYGACDCPEGRLLEITHQRHALQHTIARLDEEEARILGSLNNSEQYPKGSWDFVTGNPPPLPDRC
jgi:hypothetical protein